MTRKSNTDARKQALLDFYAQPEIRSFLNREAGWKIPEKSAMTEKELLDADPTKEWK